MTVGPDQTFTTQPPEEVNARRSNAEEVQEGLRQEARQVREEASQKAPPTPGR